MAAKGTVEKEQITNQILSVFPNAFVFGKEIRIPIGEVQIKCTLTCAKENVDVGDNNIASGGNTIETATPVIAEPSKEEIDNVNTLMSILNF